MSLVAAALEAIRDALASRRGDRVRMLGLAEADPWDPVPQDRREEPAAYIPTGGFGPRGLEVRGGR